jgi:hypothetical protein
MLAKQVLYHLSPSTIHLTLVILEMENHELFAWAGLEP